MSPPNIAAENISFFTPAQTPAAGTAISSSSSNGEATETKKVPTLFTPIQIRSLSFQNRIFVAPMCTYSCANSGPKIGTLTPFHLVHLGQLAQRGASLTIIEATAVQPNGRISPNDSGLWNDDQIAGLIPVVEYIHSQSQKVGIQLAHAGRKASNVAPWLATTPGTVIKADETVGGWPKDVKAPSALAHSDPFYTPTALTLAEIEDVKLAFVTAAQRAVKVGIDVIEIHAAHGYLLCQFMSPLSNKRTDAYGGSFANRVRLAVEICQAVRAVIPAGMPLFLRVSATEWMEHEFPGVEQTWDLPQTIELAKLLPAIGVDLLDVSSGGNSPLQKLNAANSSYQIGLAGQIRVALAEAGVKGLLIGAVGMITEAEQAFAVVEEGPVSNGVAVVDSSKEPLSKKQKVGVNGGEAETVTIEDEQGQTAKADVVLVARQFLREPEWVLRTAFKLGVEVKWPYQYHRAQFRKGSTL